MNIGMRSDCFASRLTLAQREELWSDIRGGMKLEEVALKAHRWSVPARSEPPSRQAIADWVRRLKGTEELREIGRPEGADGPVVYEEDEQIERGLRRAKRQWVAHGLEPRELAAFERNELTKRRLELAERKHEWAMRQSEQAGQLEEMERRVLAMQAQLDAIREPMERAEADRRNHLAMQVRVNLMLIILERFKYGPDWLPEKGPDGRYHRVVPDQSPVPIESVEIAVAKIQEMDRCQVWEGWPKKAPAQSEAELQAEPETGAEGEAEEAPETEPCEGREAEPDAGEETGDEASDAASDEASDK